MQQSNTYPAIVLVHVQYLFTLIQKQGTARIVHICVWWKCNSINKVAVSFLT